MKKIVVFILCCVFAFNIGVQKSNALVIFKENICLADSEYKVFPIIVSTKKNMPVKGRFDIRSCGKYKIKIVIPPQKGKLKILKDNISFEYIPDTNQTGRDCFEYKVIGDTRVSNSSFCYVTIEKENVNRRIKEEVYGKIVV